MNDARFSSTKFNQENHQTAGFASEDLGQYRTISKAAVVSVIFAILGLAAFVFPAFVILPLISVGFGLLASFYIGRLPDQLTGKLSARVATIFSLSVFAGSLLTHVYNYYTEVPEGYDRISFYDLKPKRNAKRPYSKKSESYDGEKVFLKGYVRPGLKKRNLEKFILVGDFGDCCFGGSPELTDVVAVSTKNDDDRVNYGWRMRRVSGDFKVHKTRLKSVGEKDLPYVIYEIEADDVR